MPETPILALLGPAGTGKTYKIKQKLLQNRKWAKLCATTGIAAINLGDGLAGEGVITLQSTLGFFDTPSLKDNFQTGKLRRVLANLAREYRYLVIDEASMLDAEAFDILVEALDQVNANVAEDFGEKLFGLILVGDFMQLPPVEGEYCFESPHWHRVQIEKLTEIKRQTDPQFQKLLQFAREGDGVKVAGMLQQAGCFQREVVKDDSTVLYAVNKEVDEFNATRMYELVASGAKRISITNLSWGRQRAEWKIIPQILQLAVGAYVMVLSNETLTWSFVNGDCGTLLGVDESGNCVVKLKRGDKQVTVGKITRQCYSKDTPQGFMEPEVPSKKDWIKEQKEKGIDTENWDALFKSYLFALTIQGKKARLRGSDPYWDYEEGKWVVGEVTYMPIRLAWATSVYKSQGLTLDKVQIVPSHKFFGSPNMMYVALSRCRTLEGLKVVGYPQDIIKRCNTVRKLERWF